MTNEAATPTPEQLFDQAVEQINTGATPEPAPEISETVVEAKPGEVPAETASVPAIEEVKEGAVDPFAGLPAEARDAIAQVREESARKIADAEAIAKRHQSQVAGYETNLRKAREELARAKATGDPQAAAKAKVAEGEAASKLAKTKEDFPAIADTLEAVARDVEARIRREFSTQLAAIKQSVEPIVSSHAASLETSEVAAIEAAHPGWQKTVATPEFKSWWDDQPGAIQALAKGGPKEEIALFDLFRQVHPMEGATSQQAAPNAAAANLAARRAQQLRDAAGPSGKRSTAPAADTESQSAEAMFAKAAEQVAREFRIS